MEENRTLERFVEKQEIYYSTALNEMRNGKKTSHWIWFIFPMIDGLSNNPSYNSKRYAIRDIQEAKEYMANEYLRNHLIEISEVLLTLETNDPLSVMSWQVDVMKLKSCMTLFAVAAPDVDVFKRVLQKYFNSKPDYRTLDILGISDKCIF